MRNVNDDTNASQPDWITRACPTCKATPGNKCAVYAKDRHGVVHVHLNRPEPHLARVRAVH